jgi:hypothetical protein
MSVAVTIDQLRASCTALDGSFNLAIEPGELKKRKLRWFALLDTHAGGARLTAHRAIPMLTAALGELTVAIVADDGPESSIVRTFKPTQDGITMSFVAETTEGGFTTDDGFAELVEENAPIDEILAKRFSKADAESYSDDPMEWPHYSKVGGAFVESPARKNKWGESDEGWALSWDEICDWDPDEASNDAE